MEAQASATPKVTRRQRRKEIAILGTSAGPAVSITRRQMRKLREKAQGVPGVPGATPQRPRGTADSGYIIQALPKNITELPEDMNTNIQLKRAKNEIKMLTNKTLETFKGIIMSCATVESMSYPTKLMRAKVNKDGSPKLKQCVFEKTFNKLVAIKLVDMRIDIDTIRILEYALKYASIKTILLSNISFENGVICGRFATLFDKGGSVASIDSIECLILREVDFIVVNTAEGRRFNIFMNNIVKLKNLEVLEVSNFDINRLFLADGNDISFDYMFVKLLIRLTKIGDVIFTNNIIDAYEYEYLFNEYYTERQHCYVIKITEPKDKNILNGVFVKCNRVAEGEVNADGVKETDEHYMELIYINNPIKRLNVTYYYSKGNKTSVGSRTTLPNFVNTDFEDDRGYLIRTMMKIEGTVDNSGYNAFELA